MRWSAFALFAGSLVSSAAAATSATIRLPEPHLDIFNNNNLLLSLPEASSPSSYSLHMCFGGEFGEGFSSSNRFLPTDWTKRRCVFRNLGVDEKNGTLVYYANPAAKRAPVFEMMSSHPNEHNFDLESTFYRYFGRRMRVQHTPAPPPSLQRNTAFFFPGVAAASTTSSRSSNNHSWGALWQVFGAMADTELLALDSHVVVADAAKASRDCQYCSVIGQVTNDTALAGKLLPIAVLLPIIRSSPPHMVAPPSQLSLLKQFVLLRLGVLPSAGGDDDAHSPPPPPPRNMSDLVVGLIRRHDADELGLMADHLKKRFRRVVVMDGGEAEAAAAIRAASEMDILINPTDQPTLASLFIRLGGTVIAGSTCGQSSQCRRIDAANAVWDTVPMFRKAFIPSDDLPSLDREIDLAIDFMNGGGGG